MAAPNDTCSQCCTCPTSTVQWDSVSVSKSKCGFTDDGIQYFTTRVDCYGGAKRTRVYDTVTCEIATTTEEDIRCCTGLFSYDGKRWATLVEETDYHGTRNHTDATWPSPGSFKDTWTRTGSLSTTTSISASCVTTVSCSGSVEWDYLTEKYGIEWLGHAYYNSDRSIGSVTHPAPAGNCECVNAETRTIIDKNSAGEITRDDDYPTTSSSCSPANPEGSLSLTPAPTTTTEYTDEVADAPAPANSDEYTTPELISNAIAALPDYPGTWTGTPGSYRNVSADEVSVAIRESRYRHIFSVPKVGSGLCYRLSWVERFIGEAGVAIDSAEIITRGVYRPTVSSSGGGGTGGLELVAVMASDGSVSAVRILNPGDFDTAPTITAQTAINGGTTSTGWTATLTGRQVTSVTRSGGSAGNYLPTGAFSGGGGTGATITFTLDETGGIATAPLGSGGSAYTSEPTLTITPKAPSSLAARIDLHLGVETSRCAAWDGIVPEDYDPEDNTTWPILGDGTNPYFELPVPAADGTTLVANVRVFCDCSTCP